MIRPNTTPHDKRASLPPAPADRDVVLHTRVVTDAGGGPDKTILLSASHFEDSPYWLAAAYMHPPNDEGFTVVRARAAQYNAPLISIPDRGPTDTSVLRQMLDVCRHYNVRIWHGHDYKSNMLGLMLRPFFPMKLVTTVHGWVKHTMRTPLYYAVDRMCLPYYHHVICVSQDLRDRAVKSGVPEQRCTLIRNAIDTEMYHRQFQPDKALVRQDMKVPRDRVVIGAAGRLSPEKGFADLICAVGDIVGEGKDVELWIIGEGEEHANLQKLIVHLKLEDRVRLLGFRIDMVELYHAMDLFVLSSLREGLPNVVLEAMSMQVPVVATRVAEIPGMIDHGETGLLCPIGDPEQLTANIRDAVSNAALRWRLAHNARRMIEQQFTFKNRMNQVRAIYDAVIAEPAPAAAPVAG